VPTPDAIEKIVEMRPFSDRERRLLELSAGVAYELAAAVPDATSVAWVNRVAYPLKALSEPEPKV
jgi:hypothetical protein